jgi:ligand-binding SRPBCC domain-containing protein
MLNIPMSWVTEITACEYQKYFIDEQRFGPYAFWHHQHHFEANEKGVLMTDILHYALPGGWLGNVLGGPIVHPKVKNIFAYREKKLELLF